jgi:hypothetical protein
MKISSKMFSRPCSPSRFRSRLSATVTRGKSKPLSLVSPLCSHEVKGVARSLTPFFSLFLYFFIWVIHLVAERLGP